MKGGLGNILKQAQQMQEDMQNAQAKLAQEEVIGESGGGMVRITMNGKYEVKRVEIDASTLGDDKEMLEDLVAAAPALRANGHDRVHRRVAFDE